MKHSTCTYNKEYKFLNIIYLRRKIHLILITMKICTYLEQNVNIQINTYIKKIFRWEISIRI